MTGFRRRALISLAASYVSQLGQNAANFAIKIILARLVSPADWGIYAEATLVVLVADTFTDMGLSQHFIREKHRPYGNMLLIRVLLSVAAIALILIFAPLLSFMSPDVIEPSRGLAPLILIRALSSVPRVFLERQLRIHKTLVPQFTGIILMGLVSLPLARMHYGVWALIVGTLVSEGVYTAMMWWTVRKDMEIQLRLDYTGHLLKGSRYLFLIAVVGFILQQGDIAITGSLLSPRKVGLYAMAFTLIGLVAKVVEMAIYRVIYPTFCEYSSDLPKLGRIYKCATLVMMALETPIFLFLFFNGHFFVGVLLSDKWLPMAPILAWLAPSRIIDKYSTFGIEVLRATKRDRSLTMVSVLSAISLSVFGYFLTSRYDLMGMVAANYVAVGLLPMIVALRRVIKAELLDLTKKMLAAYAISIVFAAMPNLLLGRLGIVANIASIFMMFATWVVLYLLYWNSVAKPTLAELE